MEAQLIAAVILLPATAVFIYAGVHEYRRFKSEGRRNSGLVYDEDTGTTHVSGIPAEEDGYNPDDFDPDDYNKRKLSEENDDNS